MVMRVQLVDGEYRLVLPPEVVEEFKLKEGDTLRVEPMTEDPVSVHRTVSMEEGMAALDRFEAAHRETFLELAK